MHRTDSVKPDKAKSASNPTARIAELVQAIQAAEAELQQMMGGQLDAVVTPGQQPYLLRDAQEKLSASEAAQRSLAETQIRILNALPAHVALLDGNGVIIVVNESWRSFASANVLQSPDFFVGQNYIGVCEAAHGECSEEAHAVAGGIRQVLSGAEKVFALEYPCHSPVEKRWFRLMVTPLNDQSGAGAVVMHVNVTERRLAEEALREREREQRRLAETLTVETQRLNESQAVAHVGSWVTDLATLKITWTEETYRIFEVSPDEFHPTYQRFLELVHPDDRAKLDAAFVHSHGRPEAVSIEHRICLPGGGIKFVEERWQTFNDEAGQPVRAVGTCQDITTRTVANQKLRETEERNHDTVQSALDAIISIDHEGRIIEFNPSAEKVFGWTRDEVLQKELSEVLIPERLRASHRHGFATLVASESKRPAPRRMALPALRADGLEILIELTLARLGHSVPPCYTAFIRDITAQAQSEARLAESQRRYRDLVESSHDLIWAVDATGRITFLNQACRRIYGRAPEEMVGRVWLDFVPPDQYEKDLAIFTQAVQTKRATFEYVSQVVRKDGSIVHLSANARILKDEAGQVIGSTGVSRDMTESLRAQETLRASENRLRTIVQNEPECVKTVSLDGLLLDMNPAGLRMIEAADIQAVVGKVIADLVHPEDRAIFTGLHTRSSRGETGQAEFRVIGLKGTERWMDSTSAPLRAADGTITAVLSVTRDITQSKISRDILRASEARFRALFDQAAVGMCLVSTEGEFLRTNRRFCEIVGYSAEVLSTRRWIETTHPDERARESEIIARMLAGELQSDSWEKRYVRQDGRVLWCNLTMALIPGESGEAQQFFGIIEDITERKKAEELLLQNQTMLRIAGSEAKLGGWRIDLPEYKLTWSDETSILHDLAPGHTPSLEEAIAFYPPEYRDEVSERVHFLCTEGIPFNFEHELITARQRRIWVRSIGEAQRDNAGQIVRLYGAFQDITDLKAADLALIASNRALKLLGRCNEALIRSENEADLLHEICRIAVEIGGFAMAWVGYAQDNAKKTIDPQASAGKNNGYLAALQLSWSEDHPGGQGPAGQVIRSGEPVIISDLCDEPSFAPWLATAQAHGYAGLVALPLREHARTFGVLVLYAAEVRTRESEELHLLRELSDDLTFGIVNLRSQQARRRMEAAVMKVATSVSASVSDDFFTDLAASIAEAADAQGAFVARLLPDERAMVRTVAAVVDGKVMGNFDYALRGTPCENLMDNPEYVVSKNVAGQFPQSPSLAVMGAEAYAGRRLVNAVGQTVGFYICSSASR